jgi:hypothetical protein
LLRHFIPRKDGGDRGDGLPRRRLLAKTTERKGDGLPRRFTPRKDRGEKGVYSLQNFRDFVVIKFNVHKVCTNTCVSFI